MSTTAQQLYNHCTKILDGEQIDTDEFLLLVALAKNRREAERPWQFLKKEDSSQTAGAGDTYLTMKTLPTDFALDYKMFVGDSLLEYTPVPFEERRAYGNRNSARKYYVDLRNSQFALTGSGESGTIYLIYIAFTSDPTALADTMTTAWPDRFLPLLAFDVAAMHRGGIDADDQNARMGAENRLSAQILHNAMVDWNTNLAIRAMNHQGRRGGVDVSSYPNVPNIN